MIIHCLGTPQTLGLYLFLSTPGGHWVKLRIEVLLLLLFVISSVFEVLSSDTKHMKIAGEFMMCKILQIRNYRNISIIQDSPVTIYIIIVCVILPSENLIK